MRRVSTMYPCIRACAITACLVIASAGIAPADPPPNDSCDTAIEMWSGGGCSYNYQGSTVGATNDYDPWVAGAGESCTAHAAPGGDVVFVATPYYDGIISAYVIATGWSPSMYIIDDCGDPAGSCLVGYDDGTSYAQVFLTGQVGHTYYVIVDSRGGGGGPYHLSALVGSLLTPAEGARWGAVKSLFR